MNTTPKVFESRRDWNEDRKRFNDRANAQLDAQQQEHETQMVAVQTVLDNAESALLKAATVSEEAKSIADTKSREVDELINEKRNEVEAMIATGRESLNVIKDQVIAGQQIERADHEYEAYVKAVKEARWWLIAALIGVAVGIIAVWANPPDSTFAAWLSRGGVFAASLIAFRGSQMASRRAEDHRVSAEVLKHQGLGHATINAYIVQGEDRADFDEARRRVVDSMITGHLDALSQRMLNTRRYRRRDSHSATGAQT
ncbi:MAG: hypothetical protein OXH61_10515 [Acidimicrobiaceae bacterium]|nr:hypothetical protein [Acidimicrobiaceae bacterium]